MLSFYYASSEHLQQLDSIVTIPETIEINLLQKLFEKMELFNTRLNNNEIEFKFKSIEYKMNCERINKYSMISPFDDLDIGDIDLGAADHMTSYMILLYNIDNGQTSLYVFSMTPIKKISSIISTNTLIKSINFCCDFKLQIFNNVFKESNLKKQCTHFNDVIRSKAKEANEAQLKLLEIKKQYDEAQYKYNILKDKFETQQKITTDFIKCTADNHSFKLNPNYQYATVQCVIDALKALQCKL